MSPRFLSSAFGSTGFALLVACSDPASKPNDSTTGGGEPVWVDFIDDDTGFATAEVHDSNREVVRFDSNGSAMVDASGTRVTGWTTRGNDLDWDRNGVDFRVLFGAEAGERRAYFTETGSGTICDLSIAGPDQLTISSTNEPPPQP